MDELRLFLFLYVSINFRERKGMGERDRNIDEREASMACLLLAPSWGSSP